MTHLGASLEAELVIDSPRSPTELLQLAEEVCWRPLRVVEVVEEPEPGRHRLTVVGDRSTAHAEVFALAARICAHARVCSVATRARESRPVLRLVPRCTG